MSFHKCLYPIRMIPTYKTKLEFVNGWVDEDQEYFFYNKGKMWIGVDFYSGTWICKKKTRKECVEWIKDHQDTIQKRKEELAYLDLVLQYREMVHQALQNLK